MNEKTNIAIFASGGGSNAEALMKYFEHHPKICIALVVTNVEKAGVIAKAERFAIPTRYISKKNLLEEETISTLLSDFNINYIVLAGFLLLLPTYLIEAFEKRIINIHPALLPAFGGKGMYGENVHKAVAAAKAKITGITIHFCNAHYDQGDIIFQAACKVSDNDSPEEIARNVLKLEHAYYAMTIERVISTKM